MVCFDPITLCLNCRAHHHGTQIRCHSEWTTSTCWAVHHNQSSFWENLISTGSGNPCWPHPPQAQYRHLLQLLHSFCDLRVKCRPLSKQVWAVLHKKKKDCHLSFPERRAESTKLIRGILFSPAAIVSVNPCQVRLRWHVSQWVQQNGRTHSLW